jgi:hypothetical protein
VLGSLIWAACARGSSDREIRGILVEVQSHQIVNADEVTLRDADGELHTFRVDPEVASNPDHPNTASHLRQHMINADPVIIRYRDTPEGPVAVRILDVTT